MQLAEKFRRSQGRVDLSEFPEELIKKANDVMSVRSLSATASSVPMWSHYAEKHTGLCMKIPVNRDNGDGGLRFQEQHFKKKSSPKYAKGFQLLSKVD